MKLFGKALAVLLIWTVTIAGDGFLVTAPDLFRYHYRGTWSYDWYSWLSAMCFFGSFLGAIILTGAAVAGTVALFVCGSGTKSVVTQPNADL